MAIPRSQLDHIVVTAPTLAAGSAYVRRCLGIEPEPGGKHPRMGTHNRFVNLGDGRYLEVIAVDPSAPPPGRPRWFALDRVGPATAPRLAAWVARTDDIEAAAAAVHLGAIEPMTRGALHWRITIPADGSLPCDGMVPTLIQWPSGMHPTATMADAGCRLVGLSCFHPAPDQVAAMLRALGLADDVTIQPLPPGADPHLVARIETPRGHRRLGGPA
ncbi:MAG: VOC family protein [Alphaproteobacteria bacterium]